MQDDWLTNSVRSIDATSKGLPEYGGNLKEIQTIPPEKKPD